MSSNKNWPSMFKSKPCNNSHHHQHENDTPSYTHNSNCNISPSFSSDRVPDPKPRWNPKPEQIRILESIFNSGIVNPPREEIQRIRIRLQEHGQIDDTNVFYWFQNRKSRAKHKRHVHRKSPKMSNKDKIISPGVDADHCFGLVNQETGLFPVQNNEMVVTEPTSYLSLVQNDPTAAQSGFGFEDFVVPVTFPVVNNGLFPVQNNEMFVTEPAGYLSPVQNDPTETQSGFGFGDFVVPVTFSVGNNGLFPVQNNEMFVTEPAGYLSPVQNDPTAAQSGFGFGDFVVPVTFPVDNNGLKINESLDKIPAINFYSGDGDGGGENCFSSVPLTTNQSQEQSLVLSGGEDAGDCVSLMRLTVFINDMPFEVTAGLFNVKEAFGNDAVLINSFGQPILTDEYGVTFQPLQNYAVYYLI